MCPNSDESQREKQLSYFANINSSEETEMIKQEKAFLILQAAYFGDQLTLEKLLISHPVLINALSNQQNWNNSS